MGGEIMILACTWLPDWVRDVIRNFDAHQGFWFVLLTGLLVVVGFVTCLVTMWNDRKRSRPYVVLETLPGFFLGVKLCNVGLTLAKNVKVVSDPPLRLSFKNYRRDINFISRGVPYLPPRAGHQTHIGTLDELKMVNPDLVFSGTITYESDSGKKFEEDFTLDYSLYEGVTDAPENEIAKRIRELKELLNLLFTGFYKLHVLTDDYQEYNARVEAALEKQHQEGHARMDAEEAGDKGAGGSENE